VVNRKRIDRNILLCKKNILVWSFGLHCGGNAPAEPPKMQLFCSLSYKKEAPDRLFIEEHFGVE